MNGDTFFIENLLGVAWEISNFQIGFLNRISFIPLGFSRRHCCSRPFLSTKYHKYYTLVMTMRFLKWRRIVENRMGEYHWAKKSLLLSGEYWLIVKGKEGKRRILLLKGKWTPRTSAFVANHWLVKNFLELYEFWAGLAQQTARSTVADLVCDWLISLDSWILGQLVSALRYTAEPAISPLRTIF